MLPRTTWIVFVLLLFATAAAYGQADETSFPNSVSRSEITDLSVTPSALLARIDAQQRQIDELRTLVDKLQARMQTMQAALDPIASTRPAAPSLRLATFAHSATETPIPDAAPDAPQSATPAAPKPAPGWQAPRELLPDIGQIGAEIGLFLGGSTNPYKDNKGFATGGYIDLPWKRFKGGKLSYEIMLGLQKASTPQKTTSGVNVLANAVLNSYLGNTAANQTSVTNYLAGPLPITSNVTENSKVLTVAPVLLKYSVTSLGRFKPYIVGGLGMYVWIGSNDNSSAFNANSSLGNLANIPVGGSTLGATLNAILQGSQIGGLAPTAPELAARGVAHGQGNLLFGGQIGGGFEYRITPKLSMGVDVRRNQVEGTNASFTSFMFKQGLHW